MIGIEKIGAYPGSLRVDLEALAARRGEDPSFVRDDLLLQEGSKLPLWEDSVTMAVNAARPLLSEEERSRIGLFIVATETGLDQEKALATWAHQHLDLPSTCRLFELKVACHAGAAALKMAECWLASGLHRGRKALVVTSDMSYSGLGKGRVEYSLGGGALALLVSDAPAVAAIEPGRSGIHARDVTDVIRPLPWKEIASDVDESLFAYLDGLEYSFEDYCRAVAGEAHGTAEVAPLPEGFFDYHVYHVPFPGISRAAHRRFMEIQGLFDKGAVRRSFERKVLPSLRLAQRIGATYAGSIFLATLSLLRHAPDLKAGDRVGVYSYGSGSCAEFFSLVVGERGKQLAADAAEHVEALLEERQTLSVDQYEALDRARHGRGPGGGLHARPRRARWLLWAVLRGNRPAGPEARHRSPEGVRGCVARSPCPCALHPRAWSVSSPSCGRWRRTSGFARSSSPEGPRRSPWGWISATSWHSRRRPCRLRCSARSTGSWTAGSP